MKKVTTALLAYLSAVALLVGVDEVKQSKAPIPIPSKSITLSLFGLAGAMCYFSYREDKEKPENGKNTKTEKKHITKHTDGVKSAIVTRKQNDAHQM